MHFLNDWISHTSIKRVDLQSKTEQPLPAFLSIPLPTCFHLFHSKNIYMESCSQQAGPYLLYSNAYTRARSMLDTQQTCAVYMNKREDEWTVHTALSLGLAQMWYLHWVFCLCSPASFLSWDFSNWLVWKEEESPESLISLVCLIYECPRPKGLN